MLGAGITGLTAAHRLAAAGCHVRVFESTGRIGGAIGSERVDGWLVEHGPNSLLENEPALRTLIAELGLADERVVANPAAQKRFIVRDGRPVPVPMSPPALLTSPLFSLRGKLGILSELFTRPRVRTTDLSLAEFVRSHFGAEAVAYGLNPFVSGVYAGNPDKLSSRHAFPALWATERRHGSILRGQIARTKERRARGEPAAGIISFREGLQTLPNALAARLPAGTLALNARIDVLLTKPHWHVVWNDGADVHTEAFDAVVSALPAAGLASLRFGTLSERPLASLETIEHPPVTALFLGYPRARVAHALDGFGVLVPAVERRQVLGVLFSSTLFPGRAPAGHVALTVMVGGSRQPELAALAPERLLERIQPDLAGLLGVQGDPVFVRATHWRRAIPQYNLGHERHLEAMTACENAHPGFFIGGQARDGIAVPACVAAGEKLARRALGA